MGNELTTATITPTPQLALTMQPQELIDHRSQIIGDVEMILQGYWQTQLSAEMKARVLADWADTLQDWDPKQILWALRKWRDEFPSKKPNPSHIAALLGERRGRAHVARTKTTTPEPEARVQATPEERAKIMAEVGYSGDGPKTFGPKRD